MAIYQAKYEKYSCAGHTAIPDEPLSNKVGTRAGNTDGSFCELSKLGLKSTYACKSKIRNFP